MLPTDRYTCDFNWNCFNTYISNYHTYIHTYVSNSNPFMRQCARLCKMKSSTAWANLATAFANVVVVIIVDVLLLLLYHYRHRLCSCVHFHRASMTKRTTAIDSKKKCLKRLLRASCVSYGICLVVSTQRVITIKPKTIDRSRATHSTDSRSVDV